MRRSSKIKTTLGLAAVLSTIGAVAWAQNLEVKGNAWFATGGSGSAGIGTNTPLGKLHVIAPGGFGPNDNGDGTAQAGNVPIVAQGKSTVIGFINSNNRIAGAINIDGDGNTAGSRGYIGFFDRTNGVWNQDLVLNNSNVGIGTAAPAYRLDVAGDAQVQGWVRTVGQTGWYNQTYQGGWYMTDTSYVRSYAGKSIWTDGSLVVSGNVGIGTAAPAQKLDVAGNVGATGIAFSSSTTPYQDLEGGAGSNRAAIQNASDYNTLMILGRFTSSGRKVDVWDHLEVHGAITSDSATAVYTPNSQCGLTGVLVTAATCDVCTSYCYDNVDQTQFCCATAPVDNTPVGRLISF
jgi:Bacterial shufflon protein, N-terminal constant region